MLFPDDASELWDEDNEISFDFHDHTVEEAKGEIDFLKKMHSLKESGKSIYTFDQRYVF